MKCSNTSGIFNMCAGSPHPPFLYILGGVLTRDVDGYACRDLMGKGWLLKYLLLNNWDPGEILE